MEENILLKKMRAGASEAYHFLFEEYYGWLCNYVVKLSGDQQLAEDIVQETLLKIWERRKTLLIRTSIKNYLFKSCHNQFLMHLRKEEKHKNALETIRWNTVFEVYEEQLGTKKKEEQLEKLHSLLEQLPPRCKEVFVKGKLHQLPYKLIALEMGISIKTVEAQMSKALSFLRQHAHLLLL